MRILMFCREGYPVQHPTSYVVMHHAMALQDLGHDVHIYNLARRVVRLADYLEAYEFDLLIVDVEFLASEELRRTLRQYRKTTAVHAAGALYSLPPPHQRVWEVLDFAFTPWKGKSISALAGTVDIRYLAFGYSETLHRRQTDISQLGPMFVGNCTGRRQAETEAYLQELRDDRVVLCVGPGFEQNYLDPFVLGRIYAAARCLPNFHYLWAKGEDLVLNERFWQSARCGIPVNDYHPLMKEVFDPVLLRNFCFDDKQDWLDRVRKLNSGEAVVPADLLEHLGATIAGNSYHDRMKQLLSWIA
jgi:hypothetical protein